MISAIILLIFAVWSDRVKMRYPFILAGLVMLTIGFAINISDVPIGVKYLEPSFAYPDPMPRSLASLHGASFNFYILLRIANER